jgi:hypothetical protein
LLRLPLLRPCDFMQALVCRSRHRRHPVRRRSHTVRAISMC